MDAYLARVPDLPRESQEHDGEVCRLIARYARDQGSFGGYRQVVGRIHAMTQDGAVVAIDLWNLEVSTPLRRDNPPPPNAQNLAKYPLLDAPSESTSEAAGTEASGTGDSVEAAPAVEPERGLDGSDIWCGPRSGRSVGISPSSGHGGTGELGER